MDTKIIMLACLLVLGILTGIIYEPQQSSAEMITETSEQLKMVCVKACSGEAASAILHVPNSTTLYTTSEAVCAKYESLLACGQCPCALLESNKTIHDGSKCSMEGTPPFLNCS
jgi:hypothetical protein